MSREYSSSPQRRVEEDDATDAGAPAPGTQPSTQHSGTADLDSLLDEIDGVLETNAEEFIQGFVQKGGQ